MHLEHRCHSYIMRVYMRSIAVRNNMHFVFVSLLLQGSILFKYSLEMSRGEVSEFDHGWRVASLVCERVLVDVVCCSRLYCFSTVVTSARASSALTWYTSVLSIAPRSRREFASFCHQGAAAAATTMTMLLSPEACRISFLSVGLF